MNVKRGGGTCSPVMFRLGEACEAIAQALPPRNGDALMEYRNGLVVDGLASPVTGRAECFTGEVVVMRREEPGRSVTVGADKAYDTAEFVWTCKAFSVEAQVARYWSGRRSNNGE